MGASSQDLVRYTAGELFCGAGGLSRGFHGLGFQPLFANDLWSVALHTFLMNFDEAYAASNGAQPGHVLALPGSIEDIDPALVLQGIPSSARARAMAPGELDVLLGGPPCQGYSVNSHVRSAKDPRNFLFRHYVRVLRALAPKVFVLENVPGMFSLDGGKFFDELITTISEPKSAKGLGYEVDYKILNAAHYGVPQERFRVVVIGTRRDVAESAGKVRLPSPVHYSLAQAHFKGGRSHTFHYAIGHGHRSSQSIIPLIDAPLLRPRSVGEAIGDLPPLINGGGINSREYDGRSPARNPSCEYQRMMREGALRLMNHWCRELQSPNTERVKHIPTGGDWRDIPKRLLPPGMQRALRKDHTTRYGRLDPDSLAGTLLTKPDPHWGTFLHYDIKQQRLISVREAARLQSFPDCHVFFGSQVDQYRLCGNAVPPLMAKAVAGEVRTVLDRLSQERRYVRTCAEA